MFKSLQYYTYNASNKTNSFHLYDDCFTAKINTPPNSPNLSLMSYRFIYSGGLTAMTLIDEYEKRNLYVPSNLAHYYHWLMSDFTITPELIKTQLDLISKEIKSNSYVARKYLKPTIIRVSKLDPYFLSSDFSILDY